MNDLAHDVANEPTHWLDVQCPKCKSRRGYFCVSIIRGTKQVRYVKKPHAARIVAAKKLDEGRTFVIEQKGKP